MQEMVAQMQQQIKQQSQTSLASVATTNWFDYEHETKYLRMTWLIMPFLYIILIQKSDLLKENS